MMRRLYSFIFSSIGIAPARPKMWWNTDLGDGFKPLDIVYFASKTVKRTLLAVAFQVEIVFLRELVDSSWWQ